MRLSEVLPSAQFIRVDLFPAEIKEGLDISGDKRVIVTDTHFIVLADSPRGPVVAFQSGLLDFDGSNKIGWTASTEDGEYTFKRASGCGCGSRLRGASAFPGVPHSPLRST